jgi:TolA-binding protein
MKHLRWAVAAGAVLVVVVAAGTAAATSAMVATPKYPAACKKVVPCVDNHLNNLDARLRNQHEQIVALQSQIATMSNQLATMSNQLNCYGWVKAAQYPHGSGTSSGDTTPANGGTWLDLMHPDNPANNQVYPLVVNWCQQ